MADNTKKPFGDSHKPANISESNTAALSGSFQLDPDQVKLSIEVKNAMPPPPNPNKGKGTK